MKRRFWFAFALLIPLALFLVARNATTFRPQPMAPGSPQTFLLTTPQTHLVRSRSGRFLASNAAAILWDLNHPSQRQPIPRGLPVFSPDETRLAIVTPSYQMFERYDLAPARVEVRIENLQNGQISQLERVDYATPRDHNLEIRDGCFSPDNATFSAVNGVAILRWDVASGKLISNAPAAFDAGWEVGFFAGGAKIWGRSYLNFSVFDARSGRRERSFANSGVLLADERFYAGESSGDDAVQIYRVSDGQAVFEPLTMRFIFSPDGRTLAREIGINGAYVEVQLIEVGTWRIRQTKKLTPFTTWIFEDAAHLLTLDDKNHIVRWRLR